jgi:hypothetical protein
MYHEAGVNVIVGRKAAHSRNMIKCMQSPHVHTNYMHEALNLNP